VRRPQKHQLFHVIRAGSIAAIKKWDLFLGKNFQFFSFTNRVQRVALFLPTRKGVDFIFAIKILLAEKIRHFF
jgi:hypothetical protein